MYLCARVVVSVCLFRVFGLPVFMFDIDVCVRDVCVLGVACVSVYTCTPDLAACNLENTDVPSTLVVKHVSLTWLGARWESEW